MDQPEYILSLQGITKRFPGVVALSNMQLQLKQGELLAVCGENGAGKSTLMKIITGVYKHDEGDIILKGEKIDVKDPNHAYSKGIAIIYQETSLFPDITVLENLFMGHEPQKKVMGISVIDYNAMREKASQIFNKLNIEIDLDETVGKLGVATKQIVEIAKALTYDADILILDEPTAALTNREVRALFDIIGKLKSEGVSMVYISHRLEEIFEIADRVMVIRDGSHVNTADIKDVTADQLISWMVGRDLENLYPKTEVELGDTVLEVRDVYQENVLKGVSLKLRKGEILGIAGLMGSGRTELAHAICGITKKGSGEMLLDGEPVDFKSYKQAMRKGLLYVSEDRKSNGLIIQMSVLENFALSMYEEFSRIDFPSERKSCLEYIKMLSIKTPSEETIINNLSGGNQQKVSVARALCVSPKILVLDEPTRGVDVGAKAEIHRIISGLAEKGLSIIMISSDMPEIIGMSDRVYVMKEGKISGEFVSGELSQEKILAVAL